MRIGEVSKLLNIPKVNLIFYEAEGITNTKREKNRYRVYTEEDIFRVKLAQLLGALNVPLKDIKVILKDETKADIYRTTCSLIKGYKSELDSIFSSYISFKEKPSGKDATKVRQKA